MNKTLIILILILVTLVLIITWLLVATRPTPLPSLEIQKQEITSETTSDVMQQINEGTSVNDIEQDLNLLTNDEEEAIGNIEREINKMEQELSTQDL